MHDQLAAGTTVTSIVERYLQTARDTQHLGSFLHLAEEHALHQVHTSTWCAMLDVSNVHRRVTWTPDWQHKASRHLDLLLVCPSQSRYTT